MKYFALYHSSIQVLLLLATSFASAQSYNKTVEQKRLNANKAKWNASLRSSGCGYVMTLSRGCFCMLEDLGPFHVVVNSSGEIAMATYLEAMDEELSGTEVPDPQAVDVLTVQGVFDEIQEALDDEIDGLEVTYDATNGVPTKVSMDSSTEYVDDEMTLSIENVILL